MYKNTFSSLLLLAFLFPLTLLQAQDEMALVKQIWGMEKQAMLQEYMAFTDTEAEAFWPLYESYMTEKSSLVDARIQVIQDYAANLGSMTDDKAQELTKATIGNDMKLLKLQQKYYKKMSKALSPLRASEFLQVERYLDTAIRSEVQEVIPFIGEIEELKN